MLNTLLLFVSLTFVAPLPPPEGFVLPCVIENGDTIPFVQLPEFLFYQKRFLSEKERKAWYRLVYNVRKVYPYSKIAGKKLGEYNAQLALAKSETERKTIMKKAEAMIKADFQKDLMNLTISQGKVLLKLVYRETGNSSYSLVRELRGRFTAFFYQGFARIFGYNLKVVYEPLGRDRDVEGIVWMIETGRMTPIPLPEKEPKVSKRNKK
ncbi:MAG: DUF4294 domain-containing protein [Bacteroidales bacterium]